MFNKKRIAELEAEIDFKTQVAKTRQDRYLAIKHENEALRAEISSLKEKLRKKDES